MTGRNIWNAGHRCRTSTDTRQAAVAVPLLWPRPGLAARGLKACVAAQGACGRQDASVVEFELLPIRKVAFPFHVRCTL